MHGINTLNVVWGAGSRLGPDKLKLLVEQMHLRYVLYYVAGGLTITSRNLMPLVLGIFIITVSAYFTWSYSALWNSHTLGNNNHTKQWSAYRTARKLYRCCITFRRFILHACMHSPPLCIVQSRLF